MVEAPLLALLDVKGLKGAKAAQLLAAIEVARRVAVPAKRGNLQLQGTAAAEYLKERLRGLADEQFRVLYLNRRHALLEDALIAQDAVADLRQGLLRRLLDLVVGALPPSGDDHFPTLLGGEAQPGMTGTDAVLATAFATMLANQAGGLFVRQVSVGSPIGELPLVVGVVELRQLIAGPHGNFSRIDTVTDVVRQSQQREGPAHLGGRHAESFGDLLAGPAVQLPQGGVSSGFFDRMLAKAVGQAAQRLRSELGTRLRASGTTWSICILPKPGTLRAVDALLVSADLKSGAVSGIKTVS